jgi:hypothetical protein
MLWCVSREHELRAAWPITVPQRARGMRYPAGPVASDTPAVVCRPGAVREPGLALPFSTPPCPSRPWRAGAALELTWMYCSPMH